MLLDRRESNDQIYLKMFENDAALLLYDLLINANPQSSHDHHRTVPLNIKKLALKVCLACASAEVSS